MKHLLLILLVSLSPSLPLWSESGPTPPKPGASAWEWADYNNAVAAWNQRELAAKQQAAQAAAVAAQQAATRAREAAARNAQIEFERKQAERLALQQQFLLQQEREAAIRLMNAQAAALNRRP